MRTYRRIEPCVFFYFSLVFFFFFFHYERQKSGGKHFGNLVAIFCSPCAGLSGSHFKQHRLNLSLFKFPVRLCEENSDRELRTADAYQEGIDTRKKRKYVSETCSQRESGENLL